MDSELFTIGGAERGVAKTEEVNFRAVRLMKVWQHVGQAFMVLLIILSVVIVMNMLMVTEYWVPKKGAVVKEGLQYLGASTNVVRDDTGWGNKLTPDEAKMLAQQTAETDMSTKATFVVPRERMAPTPEEELLKKQAQAQS